MRRKKLALACALALGLQAPSLAQWKPAGDRIKTEWGEKLDPANVLPEYPRPMMERKEWKNLNGLWDYAIRPCGEAEPKTYDGEILVPFAVESSLSGVGVHLEDSQELWYTRQFEVPAGWKGKRVLLHFGAVDWRAHVWVNNTSVGKHEGGYTPFCFDITDALQKGSNKLTVRVWDPTNNGPQPVGKQANRPQGIWYTAVSGIWQTVWLEPVNENHIASMKITPDIDLNRLRIEARTGEGEWKKGCRLEAEVYDNGKLVASGAAIRGEAIDITIPGEVKLWSPDTPFLYTLKVRLKQNSTETDAVDSYAAMRKFSSKRDASGVMRMQLNNRDLFQFGPLDQGWWPDGLYTAPTDEALIYDIQKTKDFGFNMIRKHVKVEPARWYAHCDRIGIIVWQDMPNGDKMHEWNQRDYFTGADLTRTPQSEAIYFKEWKEIMDYLYSYPCIGVWVPFNEGWGQFKTEETANLTKQYDGTRLVNAASGGNHYTCGDMLDIHSYPGPEPFLYDARRANVIGEYGGIGYVVKGHVWEADRNWGYIRFNTSKEVTDEYVKYAQELKKLALKGFTGAVYTQTSDVEIEVNGLMTYDRKVIKVDEKRIREINLEICNSLK